MDMPYEIEWVFITRYTQDQVRRPRNIETNENIEETVERAKDILNGSIVNMIGLNQDLQKVFKQLNSALSTIDMYDEWIEADKTNVETLFGDNDEE
jgi:hypothetical protein